MFQKPCDITGYIKLENFGYYNYLAIPSFK